MTTITTDRARLEELLGEYWEIAFEESSGVAATGNKANRVLHEIRALFDVKQAEIARLKAESEERLQNCAALVAENERLRAALATTPAQPATEPEQLKTGECWPERIMKQWDAMRDLIATGDKTSLPRDWFESLAEMRLIEAPATAPAQPKRKCPPKDVAQLADSVSEYWDREVQSDSTKP